MTLTLGAAALAVRAGAVDPARRPRRAVGPNSWIDRLSADLAVIGQAMPPFWFALLLILLLRDHAALAADLGQRDLAHFVMPAIALGYYAAPAIMRLVRAGMIEVLGSDYIRTARAKGLSRARACSSSTRCATR